MTTYNKMWQESDKLKMELFSKKESELGELESFQSVHITKNENTKGMSDWLLMRLSVSVNHGSNQPSQQRPRIEMGWYQQRHLPALTKEDGGCGTKWKKVIGLLRPYKTGPESYLAVNLVYPSRKKKTDCMGDSEIRDTTSTSQMTSKQSHGGDVATPAGQKGWASNHRKVSWALRSKGVCLASFWAYWNPSLLSSFPFLPFGMGTFILCLSHHC